MAQSHYYPSSSIGCKACYASQSSCSAPRKGSSQNSSTGCGSCNVTCNSKQAYCSIGYQNITSHGDVGTFSFIGREVQKDDFIFQVWTAAKWNQLQDKFTTANSVGKTKSQGASFSFTRAVQDPCMNTAPANSIITAAKYNEFVTAASKFSSTISQVNVDDLITAARSKALETGFANSKFNTSVCDICNTGSEHNCGYNCSCNYNCSYNCHYNCHCDYRCSCNHKEAEASG